MARVLWADDQEDVINTFRPLLSSLAPEITPVNNGTEALAKLRSEYYDILILDLMMPPGKWGGIWLLEEIHKSQIHIPVIVLSGEGTQSETIKALRLGAKDYVTKDTIESELLQRVQAAIEDSIGEIERFVTNSFPTLLALPFKRYLSTATPVSQLRRLIEFFEASLKLCSIIGICELKLTSGEKNLPLRLTSVLIHGPSMGTWNQMCHALAKQLPQNSYFFQMYKSFNDKKVNKVIQLRNDISHGAEPSSRTAEEQLGKWKPELQAFINRFWQRLSFQIVISLSLHFDGNKFQVDGHALTGDSISLPKFIAATSEPVVCNQVYLLERESSQPRWVNLYPFIIAEPAIEPNTWRVLIFDTIKSGTNGIVLTGEEPISYVDIWSGQRNVVPGAMPKSKLLPSFLIQIK